MRCDNTCGLTKASLGLMVPSRSSPPLHTMSVQHTAVPQKAVHTQLHRQQTPTKPVDAALHPNLTHHVFKPTSGQGSTQQQWRCTVSQPLLESSCTHLSVAMKPKWFAGAVPPQQLAPNPVKHPAAICFRQLSLPGQDIETASGSTPRPICDATSLANLQPAPVPAVELTAAQIMQGCRACLSPSAPPVKPATRPAHTCLLSTASFWYCSSNRLCCSTMGSSSSSTVQAGTASAGAGCC